MVTSMKDGSITLEQELEIIKELERFDTPTITNAVATYPGAPTCLDLYSPWEDNWYTDQTLRTMYPEMGPVCGFAVTCVYGLPDADIKNGPALVDVLRAIKDSPQPAVLVIKQDFPEKMKGKIGLCGGNMTTAFKSVGCVGVISDGPSRDVDEIRGMGVQYMLTGTTAGHGPMAVKAVDVPVTICGMDICPGEVIHMDENGAVKFPRKYLRAVLERCRTISQEEAHKMSMMASTNDPELIARYMKGQYQ